MRLVSVLKPIGRDTLAQQIGRAEAVLGRLVLAVRATPESYRRTQRGLWVVALALIVLAGLMPFYQDVNQVFLTQQALYLGLLALSVNFLVNNVGLISLGHAMFMAFGAYTVAVPLKHWDWSPLVGFALAPLVGAIGAIVVGVIVLRGLALYFALLTLGMGQLIWAIAHGSQSILGGPNGVTGVFGASYLHPITHPSQLYWFIFGITLVCTILLLLITRSPFGDACRGIRENRRRAEFAGLAIKRYELGAFVIAGVFGAVAGALFVVGESNIVSTQVDWQRSVLALMVVLIGGTSYFLGPFAGAVFFMYVSGSLFWIIVLFTALLLPGGLVGVIHFALAKGRDMIRGARGLAEPAREADAEIDVLGAAQVPDAERGGEVVVTASDGRPVLRVANVSKRFGGLVAVNGVSIEVKRGTLHAIIGPNGAGKTTLFNLVTGLLEPNEGRVYLEDEDVTGTAPWRLVKRGMGRSFQQTNLFWALSSLDNLALAEAAVKDETLKLAGSHSQPTRDRSRELLERVGLGAFAEIAASELSHGDRRSLEIATALAAESKLLLLDEPTAGLSPAETRLAVELIRRIAAEQGLTVLFVEHDMQVVFAIADYITVLHRGSVLAEGPPDEVRADPAVRAAYLGEETDEARSEGSVRLPTTDRD